MNHVPRSTHDCTGGLVYLARMLDKIRQPAAGPLCADFHANLGAGFDARCCHLLGVEYASLRERVLAWCQASGTCLMEEQMLVWNKFMEKRGWRGEDDGFTQEREALELIKK